MTKTCTNLQIPCYSITGNFLNIAPFGPCRPCRPCQWFFPKAESKQKWPLSLAARPAMWEGPLPQKTLNKVDLDINDINLWLRLDTQGLPMPYCKIRSNTDYHSTYYLSINMIYLYLSILIIYVVYFLSDPMSWNWWTLELGIAHHAWQQSPKIWSGPPLLAPHVGPPLVESRGIWACGGHDMAKFWLGNGGNLWESNRFDSDLTRKDEEISRKFDKFS